MGKLSKNEKGSVKIAVAGKGGVGKTLIAGVLANFFAEKSFKVLAIDADSSPNLAITLGIPLDQASKIVPISENSRLIERKTGTGVGGIYRLSFSVEDIVKEFSVSSPYGVGLLVMGTVRSPGGGCMCPANAVVKALLRHLLVERDEVVIIDMEAGVEHVGRGTAEQVDIMLVVTEPSLKSMEIAKKLHNLAVEAGIQRIFIVGNRVRSSERGLIERFALKNEIPFLAEVPFDERILNADVQGETPLKYIGASRAIASLRKIGERILEHSV